MCTSSKVDRLTMFEEGKSVVHLKFCTRGGGRGKATDEEFRVEGVGKATLAYYS